MENTAYIALARQMAMHHQMDVIANNLANMNTSGFKSEKMLFEEYLMRLLSQEQLSFVQDYGVTRDMGPGSFERTGDPLNMAINGAGFFAVETPQGTRYTRNGRFQLDQEGKIVTSEGFALLDEGEQPIVLAEDAGKPTIARDGTISNENGEVIGRIRAFIFENEQGLHKEGSSLYAADASPSPAENAWIEQGMLEMSNVEPIAEMTTMVDVLRAYQGMQSLIEQDHDMKLKAIEILGGSV
jgi:flagellar basal-body rod protein FlgF